MSGTNPMNPVNPMNPMNPMNLMNHGRGLYRQTALVAQRRITDHESLITNHEFTISS
jgi:hypothetical protein